MWVTSWGRCEVGGLGLLGLDLMWKDSGPQAVAQTRTKTGLT